MTKTVYVTRAQRSAARSLVQRSAQTGRDVRQAVADIANASATTDHPAPRPSAASNFVATTSDSDETTATAVERHG